MKDPLSKLDNGVFDTTPKTDGQITIAHRNTVESPVLRLPRELRDVIWELCLPLTIKVSQKLPQQTNSTPSILLVSRQTYDEAAEINYNALLTWSFSCRARYEDWFWKVMHKRNKVHRLQLCVDPLDLYGMAEVEDPGRSDEEEESYGATYCNGPKLSAFANLEKLDVWVPETYMDADSDEEDELEWVEGDDGVTPTPFSGQGSQASTFEESIENFTNTMRDKNPRVKVTYKKFPGVRTMKAYWLEHS